MPNSIKLEFLSAHRSIKGFAAITLPELVVISGPNGSGKTHFLEALMANNILIKDAANRVLKARKFDSTPTLAATHVTHDNLLASQSSANDAREFIEDIERLLLKPVTTNIYWAGKWQSATRENVLKAFLFYVVEGGQPQFDGGDVALFQQALHSQPDHNGNKRNRWEAFVKFVPYRAIKYLDAFIEADIKGAIYDFIQYQTFMHIDISKIFYRYFEEQQNNAYSCAAGTSCLDDNAFKAKFGNPPWEEVNSLLKKYGFQHQIIPPSKEEDSRATKGYMARIVNDVGDYIQINDLSSGEKVIIALLLSAYAAQQKQNKIIQVDVPDVILFDELDAHLHPSMTRMMFEVIQSSIIEKLACRVMLSTHSPSTVALAPSESLFQLTRGVEHELKQVDSATACRELSDGFIQILDGSQIVIVEGKDDPLFYRAIERAIRANTGLVGYPALHFIPASKQSDPSSGGGATAAEDWAVKLGDANLPNIHALLDNDGHRQDNGAIKVLRGRYAIENFVLDPLALAVVLITDGRLASVVDASIATKFPQVSSILSASDTDLQKLVKAICMYIESYDTSLQSTSVMPVNYSFGKSINVPEWVCKRRGKDLVSIIREAFKRIDSSYVITRKDHGNYNLDLGYILKLWCQYPQIFPAELRDTLVLLRS